MLRVLHNKLPGRTRYKIGGLLNNSFLKNHLEKRLKAHDDIYDISFNTVTGNVLVLYDETKAHETVSDLITVALKEVNFEVHPETPADKKPKTSFKDYFGSLKFGTDEMPQKDLQTVSQDAYQKKWFNGANEDWHTTDVEDILRMLRTDSEKGLTPKKVQEFLHRYGPNALPEQKRRPQWYGIIDQLNSIPSYLLGAAAGLSILTGGVLDAAVIAGVLGANIAIGYLTESKAEGTIRSLQSFVNPSAWVIRGGNQVEIPIEGVVIGDILILKPGVYVAADARLIRTTNLTVDESMLTGESVPVLKSIGTLKNVNTPISDRLNMVFKGTLVTGGQGHAVVTATGPYTQVGMLQSLLHETESPPSPIERQLDQMGNQLVIMCGLVCTGVFGVGFLRGYGLLVMLRMAVSLAAAAVPEGLPSAAMVNFALGLNRMKDRHVLVRHLQAVEALGAIQTICFDKTGTITENRMTVMRVFSGMKALENCDGRLYLDNKPAAIESNRELLYLLMACVLCSETQVEKNGLDGKYEFNGSPTETALIDLALQNGIDLERLEKEYHLLKLDHRSENQLYMKADHKGAGRRRLLTVKGSPAEVMAMCRKQMVNGRITPLDDAAVRRIEIENEQMAGHQALRVIGVAFQQSANGRAPAQDLIWLGLVGMADPIRPGVRELIDRFHGAGIETIMITGDQSSTANAVARDLNLSGEKDLEILDSSVLPDMDPEKLEALAKRVNVYARVSPSHKLKIVQGLQNGGKIVAMTGDGINDGPALKAADIGIAMGKSGTDVAREVADVVLEKDNLETLMIAVRDGRAIYSNIRKSVHFFLSTNMSEILLILGSIGFGLGFPLNVMQLLWINIISDILPGLALSMEEAEPDIMKRPPRDPHAPIFNRRDFTRMAAESGIITGASLGAYLYGIARYGAGGRAGTLAFHSLTIGQLLHAYSCRSEFRHARESEKMPPNKHLNMAIGGSLVLQILTMLVPSFRRFLGITPINVLDGVVITAGSMLPYVLNERLKKRVMDV